MGRPTITRSVKRKRLRELKQEETVAGQVSPNALKRNVLSLTKNKPRNEALHVNDPSGNAPPEPPPTASAEVLDGTKSNPLTPVVATPPVVPPAAQPVSVPATQPPAAQPETLPPVVNAPIVPPAVQP